MAILPNSLCQKFCYWMLNISWQQLTNPRRLLIETVYNAAVAQTTVTDTEFNNFTQVSSWRYPYFLVWLQTGNQWLPETLAYTNAFAPAAPDTQIAAIDAFINSSINNGNWATFDAVFLLACNSSAQALVNMKNPSSTKASLIGAPTFTQNVGVAGNGTTTGINSNWNPSTMGVNFTLNAAHMAVYNRTPRAAAAQAQIGGVTTGPTRLNRMYTRYTANIMIGSVNAGSDSSAPSVNNAGWFQSIRTTNVLTTEYWNDTVLGTSAVASAALVNQNMAICGQYLNGVFGTEATSDQLALVIFGGVPADNTALYNDVQNLAGAIGFIV